MQPGPVVRILSTAALWLALIPTTASEQPALSDYDAAMRADDFHRVHSLRLYILGAVDTHLHYSRKLHDWTRFNALCTGDARLSAQELGRIFELKIVSLKRRYGKDIMGMPIVEVVPTIVEEHYRCF